MISAEVTCLATLGQKWRTAVRSSVLNARINPGSPAFAAVVRHLQEALAASVGPLQSARIAAAQFAQMLSESFPMAAGIGHFMAVAVFGTLGTLVVAHPGRLSMTRICSTRVEPA